MTLIKLNVCALNPKADSFLSSALCRGASLPGIFPFLIFFHPFCWNCADLQELAHEKIACPAVDCCHSPYHYHSLLNYLRACERGLNGNIVLGAVVTQAIHLIHLTLLIPPIFWLHQSVFALLMSPLLNACFSATPLESPCHGSDGRIFARS